MKTKNIPQLRFTGFKEQWSLTTLGEIAVKISDGIHTTPVYDEKGEYFFINGNNLINGRIITNENTKKINEKELLIHKKDLDNQTILMSINGTIGNLAFYNFEKVILGKSACYIKLKDSIDKYFIYNYLQNQNIRDFFKSKLTGSTIKNLSLKTINECSLLVPHFSEQQKIASFLSAVDKKIQLLTRKKELLEKYKKGVMRKLFSGEMRFSDEKGRAFPMWEEKKLETISKITSGLSSVQNKLGGKIKVSRIETISDGKINLEKVGFINSNENLDQYRIMKGDILFSNINSVSHIGKTAIASDNLELYHGMNLLRVKCNSNIDPKFIYYSLNTEKMRNHFRSICNQAVSQASINLSEFSKTKLILPTFQEQKLIASFILLIECMIDVIINQLIQVNNFKKGLLQQMFV